MIKIKFIRWDNLVLMKVLEMGNVLENTFDEEILVKVPEDSKYFNEIKIMSYVHPEIMCGRDNIHDLNIAKVYLHGSDITKDYKISSYMFDSSEMAKNFIKEVQIAIKLINEREEKIEEKPEDIEEIEVY